jgi:membrane-bound lytic murein transglycosylase D
MTVCWVRLKNRGTWRRGIAALSLVAFAVSLPVATAPSAWGAYDHVVTWSDQSALDLSSVLKSQYASSGNLLDPVISDSALMVASTDADGLIDPLFKIPPQLSGAVGFWLKMYTTYTTQHVAIFDARHPEIVYEVLDFRDLARTARNQVVYEILRERRIKATIRSYLTAFSRLARAGAKGAAKNPVEKNVLLALKSVKRKISYHDLAENLKSQTGQRDNVMKGLLAAKVYFPKMELLFANMGLPRELTRITLVESSFDLSAYSRTGAQGVWQFMPAPGHHLMLIDEAHGIDERLSPLKSTVAAGRMLKESYHRFNNWALAVTSYNHGLKGLPKLARSNHSNDFGPIAGLFDPVSRKSPLGWAGRNYYAEFLAMVHAEAYRHLFYGDAPLAAIAPVAFKRLDRKSNLVELAALSGISVQALRMANPDVRDMKLSLPAGFLVAMPGDSDDLVLLTTPLMRRTRNASVSLSRKLRKT